MPTNQQKKSNRLLEVFQVQYNLEFHKMFQFYRPDSAYPPYTYHSLLDGYDPPNQVKHCPISNHGK